MQRVLTAFAALGAALVAAQKFPARPIPQTLNDRIDVALDELKTAAEEAAEHGGDGADTPIERLEKLELALFGDGDKIVGFDQALAALADRLPIPVEGVPTIEEQIAALAERLPPPVDGVPTVEEQLAAALTRIEALENAKPVPAAAPAPDTAPASEKRSRSGAGSAASDQTDLV